MKIDQELIKEIITKFVESDSVCLFTRDLRNLVPEVDVNKFIMHMRLIVEDGLLTTDKNKFDAVAMGQDNFSIQNQSFWVSVKGHEYYKIANNPKVWKKLKEMKLMDKSVSTVFSVGGKALATLMGV